MRIILAFDSYKGCLSASQVCEAASMGIRKSQPDAEVVSFPLSDGGEGLVECFVCAGKAATVKTRVHGPLLEDIEAEYAVSHDGTTAYIEMASACGLPLVPLDKRRPALMSTFGLGELLLHTQQQGVRHVVLGIGGSATCDGGVGMLQALSGVSFSEVCVPASDAFPTAVIAASGSVLSDLRFTVACDVSNPLYGPQGAAFVFAPQKGATPAEVEFLDRQLRLFDVHSQCIGVSDAHDALRPGTGAAGGLGYALLTYLHAELKPGIDVVLDAVHFEEVLSLGVDMILTGEGRSDLQTLMGKVPFGVLQRASRYHIPVHLVSGQISDAAHLLDAGFAALHGINEHDTRPLPVLMRPDVARANLEATTHSLL